MRKWLILVPLLLLVGCDPIERSAYNTVVASKAFLDSVKSKHPECNATATSAICVDLRKATAAKDVLVSAGQAYCHVDALGVTPCAPLPKGTPAAQQLLAGLQAALTGYKQAESEIKGVIK